LKGKDPKKLPFVEEAMIRLETEITPSDFITLLLYSLNFELKKYHDYGPFFEAFCSCIDGLDAQIENLYRINEHQEIIFNGMYDGSHNILINFLTMRENFFTSLNSTPRGFLSGDLRNNFHHDAGLSEEQKEEIRKKWRVPKQESIDKLYEEVFEFQEKVVSLIEKIDDNILEFLGIDFPKGILWKDIIKDAFQKMGSDDVYQSGEPDGGS
jgi:hypothetical protein